jgi:hypothetical protein
LDATAHKAKLPFLSRFGLTVASTAALVSPPLRNACFSAAANAWLAVISFSRSLAGYERSLGIFPNWMRGKVGHKVARFRQVKMDNPHTHHDALEFPDGTLVRVHALREGQHATVLQLPVALRTAEEAKEQGRVSVVG